MRKRIVIYVVAAACTVLCGGFPLAAQPGLIGARFPALSPEGKSIAFSYFGDLWHVPTAGGRAERLTNHVAYDREPIWSPDGHRLAFTSNRMGNWDVFLLSLDSGDIRQLTFYTGDDFATAFTPDGRWIIFRSSRSSSSSAFKVSVEGGNPQPLLDTYWSWPYDISLHPDGGTLLFTLGMENRFWWRRGYRGSNSAKIWTLELATGRAAPLAVHESNSHWPRWSPDGSRVYFVSDRELRVKNIWSVARDGSDVRPVTRFRDGDVLWLSTARTQALAVYERKFGIWVTDLTTGESHEVKIEAPAETRENRFFFAESENVSEFALSPDGKKIAAVVRGEIFVLSTDGGYARNVTNSPWREREVTWHADNKHLTYVSDIEANPDIYKTSALGDETPQRLTSSERDDRNPHISPDGKWIAYYSGARQIRLMAANGENDRLVIEEDFGGRFAPDFSWAPDSRHLAVVTNWAGNSDIFAVDIETGSKLLLTNTAYDEESPVWSPDGKFLLFLSNRSGHSFPEFRGKNDLYQLHFAPVPPEFDEDDFEKLFAEKAKKTAAGGKAAAGKEKAVQKQPVEIEFNLENLDLQTRRVTNTLGNDGEFVLSPQDSTTIYFVSNIDGTRHLWKTSLKKKKRGKYAPFAAAVTNLHNLQIESKGKSLYYLSKGRLGKLDLKNGKSSRIDFTRKIKVDKVADFEQMLAELYYTLKDYYYDPNHHNVDWQHTYQQFRPVLRQVREELDFYDYANMLIGFLNSSHMGIRGPRRQEIDEPSAHLGAIWDFRGGAVRLQRIIKDGPLYAHRDSLQAGALLAAVDGKPMKNGQNLWRRLNGKLDRRVKLRFRTPQGGMIDISVKPVSPGAERRLLLEEWIAGRRERVKQKTDDRIAYVYMRAMGQRDLRRFLKELERDAVPRKGLILDLRYNSGGNVHDRVIEALTKPVYAKWRIRGLSEIPQSTYGFADKPLVVLTNEQTLSDGEMLSNGLKTLGRGRLVGATTYGWLIFTTGVSLNNGGYFRLPFWGCYTLDGEDLEQHGGVQPDIRVTSDLTNELDGTDPQLDRAITEILGETK